MSVDTQSLSQSEVRPYLTTLQEYAYFSLASYMNPILKLHKNSKAKRQAAPMKMKSDDDRAQNIRIFLAA